MTFISAKTGITVSGQRFGRSCTVMPAPLDCVWPLSNVAKHETRGIESLITPRDRSLITPEESKQARECLNMSQRSVAEQAGVPRTYLNQFERRRWIADAAFLLKLSDFYFGQGGFGPVDSEESPIEEPQIITGADKDISCSEVAKNSRNLNQI